MVFAYDTVTNLSDISVSDDEIKRLMSIHNIARLENCNFKGPNKVRDESTFGLYCWNGIVDKNPKIGQETCRIARTCSQYSFADARTKFCLAFACDDPYAFINPGDRGSIVSNRRGGVIVRNADEKCTGLAGVLSCTGDSVKQSIDGIGSNPNTKKNLMITVGGLIAIALAIRFFRGKNKKKINLFKV